MKNKTLITAIALTIVGTASIAQDKTDWNWGTDDYSTVDYSTVDNRIMNISSSDIKPDEVLSLSNDKKYFDDITKDMKARKAFGNALANKYKLIETKYEAKIAEYTQDIAITENTTVSIIRMKNAEYDSDTFKYLAEIAKYKKVINTK